MFGKSPKLTKLLSDTLRMRWLRWTFGGAGIGMLVALWMGGAGLAVLGTAFAIKTWIWVPVFFGLVGHSIGSVFGWIGNKIGLRKKPLLMKVEQFKA